MSSVFAITSAFLYAIANVVTKFGLRHVSTSSGILISLTFSFGFVFIYSLFSTSLAQFFNRGTLFFLAAGITGPFCGRVLLYIGIHRVGATIACTLYEDRPLFSMIPAVIVLGEGLNVPIVLGVLLMVSGAAVISLENYGGQMERLWSRKDLLIPLASGACYGVSLALRKMGLNVMPSPVVGMMVQNIGAMALLPLLAIVGKNQENLLPKNKSAWLIFGLVGFLYVLAQWCLFKALEIGTVVVVAPLHSLSILFVLILTVLFLQKSEKVTWKIAVGALFTVSAAILLTTQT